jgi:hypothetical protein
LAEHLQVLCLKNFWLITYWIEMVGDKYFEMVLFSRGGMGAKSVANWLALAEW